jgi:hypothetical protein
MPLPQQRAGPPARMGASQACSLVVSLHVPSLAVDLLTTGGAENETATSSLARIWLEDAALEHRTAAAPAAADVASQLSVSAAAATLSDTSRVGASLDAAPRLVLRVPPAAGVASDAASRVIHVTYLSCGDGTVAGEVGARAATARWPYGISPAFVLALKDFFVVPQPPAAGAAPPRALPWAYWSVALHDASVFIPVPEPHADVPMEDDEEAEGRGVLLTWQELRCRYDCGGDCEVLSAVDVRGAALALRQPGRRSALLLHPAGAALRVRQHCPLADAAAAATTDTELRFSGELLARTGFSQIDILRDVAQLLSGGGERESAAGVQLRAEQAAAAPPPPLPPFRPRTWLWRLQLPRLQLLLADDRYVADACPDVAGAALHAVSLTHAQQQPSPHRMRASFSAKLELELGVFISTMEVMLPTLERWELSAEAEDDNYTCARFRRFSHHRMIALRHLLALSRFAALRAGARMACTSASWRCGRAAASGAAWWSAPARCSLSATRSPFCPRCRRRAALRPSRRRPRAMPPRCRMCRRALRRAPLCTGCIT